MKKIIQSNTIKKVLGVALAVTMTASSLLTAVTSIHAHEEKNSVSSYAAKTTYSADMYLGLNGINDPVIERDSSGYRVIPSDYIYFGNNNRGAMIWRVLSAYSDNLGNEGSVFLMSEYLEPQSVSGKNYDEAYLSYFTDEEKTLLVPYGSSDGEHSSAYGLDWNTSAPSGYLFAPSASDVSSYIANYSGASALRAYTDSSRSTVGNWWLRSEADGGVGYITSTGHVDTETNTALVKNYNRVAVNIDPSKVVLSTKVDGGLRLALLDERYSGELNSNDFAAWITDVQGSELTISYLNAKPKNVSDAMGEYISAIVVDEYGEIKYYKQLGEVNYTEEKSWTGWYDSDGDGSLELISPSVNLNFHGSVKFNMDGVYEPEYGDKLYVFWENAYNSREIDANPKLAFETTTMSKMVEMCWHEADPSKPATCTRGTACIKCGTEFGSHESRNPGAHVDDNGVSGIVWNQRLGQYLTTDINGNTYWKEGYIHSGNCKLCGTYFPMDEFGYSRGAEPCYCESAEKIDCTNGAICDACGDYFTDVTAHTYDRNGICTKFTHFEEPELNEGFYEIKNVGNLIWYAEYANSHEMFDDVYGAKLTGNIDFAVLQSYEDERIKNYNWTPIGVGGYAYNTVFDGNGFEIRNLRCVSDKYNALGFIGWVQGSGNDCPEVRNLGLVDCYFENTYYEQYATAAIVAAANYDLTVENCYVKNTTVIGSTHVGGIVGNIWMGNMVTNCYAIDLNLKQDGNTVSSWIASYCMNSPRYCFAYGENAGLFGDHSIRGFNCYYLHDIGNTETDNAPKSAEHFASGMVAYYLGEGFGQTLGEDAYPTFGGDVVYLVSICGGEGVNKYTYSNTDELTHVWDGNYVCGEAMTCISCGEKFGDVLEHSYTAIRGDESFIWSEGYGECAVQTYCEHCDSANPELMQATVNVNFNGGVRADYVASIFIGDVKYTSDVIRITIISIGEATGIYPSGKVFDGHEYYAIDLITNTKMKPGEYEAYFLLDGEMVGESARGVGVYDLYIIGRGRYEYQEYVYEDFFTIEKAEVQMNVSVKDKIVNGDKNFEFELSFPGGVDYSHVVGVYADQYELPSSEVGEYVITGIGAYFYVDGDENNVSLSCNTEAVARVLPRNYVEIKNISYKTEYTYNAQPIDTPKASDFSFDDGSSLTFKWYKDGVLIKGVPTDAGDYILRVHASATNEYIASSVDIEVKVHPRALNITLNPDGKYESITEELLYDADGDGVLDTVYDTKNWYIFDFDNIPDPIKDGFINIDGFIGDDTYESSGFEISYWVYPGNGGPSLGNDFPTAPLSSGYNVQFAITTSNTFGTKANYVVSGDGEMSQFYMMINAPKNTVSTTDGEYLYDGSVVNIPLFVAYEKSDITNNDKFQNTGYTVNVVYGTTLRTDENFDGNDSYINRVAYEEYKPYSIDEFYYPSTELTVNRAGVYYVRGTVYANYYGTDGEVREDEQLLYARVTIDFVNSNGEHVEQMINTGIYSVNIKVEHLDADGEVAFTDVSAHQVRIYEKKELWIIVKETEINLDGTPPKYNPRDIVFVPGYTLSAGDRIVDLTYSVEIGGYQGAFNMGYITIKDWVIVDENGNDVSNSYVVNSDAYRWYQLNYEAHGRDENYKYPFDWLAHASGYHGVVHVYSNGCDSTCNIDRCTNTRDVAPHTGGVATCDSLATCEVCGSEYGEYDYKNHSGTSTVYVRNPDDFHYHDLVYACCGTVISTDSHTITKAATCTTLAECELCGVVEGYYDFENHSSNEFYYAQNQSDSAMHDCIHKCCDAVKSTEAHKGGKATCTALAVCDTCQLGYGKLDEHNHSSEEFTYTSNGIGSMRHSVYHACCGVYVGTEEHYGGNATCIAKATCEKCGESYGDLDNSNHASHEYRKSASTIGNIHYIYTACCGIEVGSEEHSGGNATCTTKAVCDGCGSAYGKTNPDVHSSENRTYKANANDVGKHDVIASCCGAIVATEGHAATGATCTESASCEACGVSFGDRAEHTYRDSCDSDCDVCGLERLPGHVDANSDKLCDACGVKLGDESDVNTETESGSESAENNSVEAGTASETDNNGKKGCKGSVAGSSAILISLVGAMSIAFSKKKKEDLE